MAAEAWEFEEAIECFRVIDSSLRCIYSGELHMYRVLSTQLRILLCDTPKPLLVRLFPDLQLTGLQPIERIVPGEFPVELNHLNSIESIGSQRMVVSCMPFESRLYSNGIEDCQVILRNDKLLLPVEEWVGQYVTLDPVPVTIRKLIRTVADRGGGAHVHKSSDALLNGLCGKGPGKLHQAALILIAISKTMQSIGFSVIQLYERGESSLPLTDFDHSHPWVLGAARVPSECLRQPYTALNLLWMGPE